MATQTEIRDVLAATDIAGLIGESIALKKAGAEFVALCPFHQEKTPSFTVVPTKGWAHCFGCGWHGDALSWLREYSGLTFRQALDELAGRAGITIGAQSPGERTSRRTKQATAELEAALHHELMVLDIPVGERVTYRAIPLSDRQTYSHIQAPNEQPLEREYEAARRIAKALYALYGVRL